MFLIIGAVLPALVLMIYIYKKDTLEKESPGILIKCILAGLLATIASMILETIIGLIIDLIFGSGLIYSIVENFIGVALIEEGAKLFFCYLFVWKSREFNYKFDGVVYMVFTSLGFAAFENIGYAFSFGAGVLASRAIFSIPGHLGFSVFTGSYLGRARMYANMGLNGTAQNTMITGLIMATLLHGFYDFCLSNDSIFLVLGFYVFVILMDIIVISRINRDSRNDSPIS